MLFHGLVINEFKGVVLRCLTTTQRCEDDDMPQKVKREQG